MVLVADHWGGDATEILWPASAVNSFGAIIQATPSCLVNKLRFICGARLG